MDAALFLRLIYAPGIVYVVLINVPRARVDTTRLRVSPRDPRQTDPVLPLACVSLGEWFTASRPYTSRNTRHPFPVSAYD